MRVSRSRKWLFLFYLALVRPCLDTVSRSGSQVQGESPAAGHQDCQGWRTSCKEMLEELGFPSLEKRGLRREAGVTGRVERGSAEALGHKAWPQSSPAGRRLFPCMQVSALGRGDPGMEPGCLGRMSPQGDHRELLGGLLPTRVSQAKPHGGWGLSCALTPRLHQPWPRRRQSIPGEELCAGAVRAQRSC